jgi:hypothetical protein
MQKGESLPRLHTKLTKWNGCGKNPRQILSAGRIFSLPKKYKSAFHSFLNKHFGR